MQGRVGSGPTCWNLFACAKNFLQTLLVSRQLAVSRVRVVVLAAFLIHPWEVQQSMNLEMKHEKRPTQVGIRPEHSKSSRIEKGD